MATVQANMSSYPQGFNNGISIRGVPLLQSQTGTVYWVNNSSVIGPRDQSFGSDGNHGTYLRPFATLGKALAACQADHGDIIMVGAGHAESITSATTVSALWNVAGVSIVGLGSGQDRPTFTFTTANTATITVSANNISVQNCIFKANFLNVAHAFTLTTATDFLMDKCLVADTSAILNFLNLFKTDATATHADGFSLTANLFNLLATSGVVTLFSPGASEDRVLLSGNSFISQTTNASAVIPLGASNLTNALIVNNYFNLQNAVGTATAFLITTSGGASSGFIDGNKDHALPTTPLLVTAGSGFVYGANLHSDQADLQGYLVPAADS